MFGRVFNQDGSTFGRVQRGLRASVKQRTTLARYQESRIRHFHDTIDAYIERFDRTKENPRMADLPIEDILEIEQAPRQVCGRRHQETTSRC